MLLHEVVADATLERTEYYKLDPRRLAEFDEPEANFQIGTQIWRSVLVFDHAEAGWQYVLKAAYAGHPVALAVCYHFGKQVPINEQIAIELYRASAQRGHVVGKRARAKSQCFQ
jgi:TPR repeat protein